MQTQTNQTRETFATQPDPLKLQILAALHRFVRQRPGLEGLNYRDARGNFDRQSYGVDMRGITRDLKDAETLLRQVALAHTITGEDLITASRLSFSGRLSIKVVRRWECACGHKYAAPVELSSTTPNLSGESTAWCPECGARPVHGSPHEIKIDYTTGQYFPTEYRRAVCAVAASVLWDWVRDKAMPPRAYTVAGKKEYATFEEASAAARDYLPAIVSIEETYRGLSGGDWLRRYFRREFGRGIASRWFN